MYKLLTLLLLTAPLAAQQSPHWTGSWATSQQVPETSNLLPSADLTDATLRQTIHLSLGGGQLRVHLSNAFGTAPLHIAAVHIARPVNAPQGQIDPATDRSVTFAGRPDVLIPPAAEYLSDPVSYPAASLSDVTITLYLDKPPAGQTGHPGSRATTWVAHGDQVAAPSLAGAHSVEHWYLLSAVDVAATPSAAAIVTLGDSITDGHAATTDKNERWPDVLAAQLQASPRTRGLGVLNQGIGGNHMLTDGLGPNVLARFDRDVLAQPGVRTVILLEGVNDLGALSREGDRPAEAHQALVARLIASYQQVIDRAHAQGLRVIGATITPYVGSDYYHPAPANEADRQQLNAWIRTPGHFDQLLDFDAAVADPAHPDRLLPAYDCGDHLHPSPAGYSVMGKLAARLFNTPR